MDLSFLTGNPTPQPSAMSWMPSNANQGMNFNTPAMSYQPNMTMGDFSSPNTSAMGSGLTGQLGMNIPTFQFWLIAQLVSAFNMKALLSDFREQIRKCIHNICGCTSKSIYLLIYITYSYHLINYFI